MRTKNKVLMSVLIGALSFAPYFIHKNTSNRIITDNVGSNENILQTKKANIERKSLIENKNEGYERDISETRSYLTSYGERKKFDVAPDDRQFRKHIVPAMTRMLKPISEVKYGDASLILPFDSEFKTNKLERIKVISGGNIGTWTMTVDDEYRLMFIDLDNQNFETPSKNGFISNIGRCGVEDLTSFVELQHQSRNPNPEIQRRLAESKLALDKMAARIPKNGVDRLSSDTARELLKTANGVLPLPVENYFPMKFGIFHIEGYNLNAFIGKAYQKTDNKGNKNGESLRLDQHLNPMVEFLILGDGPHRGVLNQFHYEPVEIVK